mgnify:CR=1 FL=1
MSTVKLNASSRIMYEEAVSRGIACTIFHDHETIFMSKDGHEWYTRGSRTSFQSSVGKTIADEPTMKTYTCLLYTSPSPRD